jgi:outer membrane protein assembly factor BamB
MPDNCRRFLTCAVAALATFAALHNAAMGQGRLRWLRGVVPVPAADKVEAPEAADNEEAPDEARSVVLPDNGDLRRKLDQVRQQIEGEHYADAARQLGLFLQDPAIHDFFLSRDDQRRDGRGFLAEIQRLLRELPPSGRAAYREQFEAVARTRLNAAIATGTELALRDVAARFLETRSGDEALYRLGHFLRDHGRASAAAACLERLLVRPEAAAPFEPALTLTIAACWARAGERQRARDIVVSLRGRRSATGLHIAGLDNPDLLTDAGWDDFLDRIAAPDSGANPAMQLGTQAASQNWPTFRGNPARNAAVAARPPFLASRWSRQATSNARTQVTIERAWQAYCEGNGTALPLLNPLAVGDLVFVRTARGVAAFDLATGDCRWTEPSDDNAENARLDRIIWQEPAGGAFSVDEECVYLVEDVLSGDSESKVLSDNILSAREHFHSREGNLRWQVGGRDGSGEPRLAGMYFLGPPLAWQGGLYVLAESKGALSLAVLDRLTGRLSWSQELALVEQKISEDLLRLVGGATPSISTEEIIVCPTSGGVVVALDLTTRSLLWAYRYVQRVPTQPASLDDSESAPRLDQFDRWLDGTVSIAKGRVVLTPLESREIHCLDLSDGRPVWTKAREDGMFVACVTDELAVVVGRSAVRAHRMSDGEIAWTLPFAGSFPAGRGVFAGDRYYLPVTAAAVLEIELRSGTLAAAHKSPRELPVGNLIWHQGLFVSQGPAALEIFDERETLVAQVRERLDRDPRDAEALLRQGELELTAGHIAEGIAAFRAAYTAARSPKTKSRLIAALLDGVRQNLPGQDSLAAELDALLGP